MKHLLLLLCSLIALPASAQRRAVMENLAATNNAIFISTGASNVYVQTAGTMTVLGNAFSVGASSFTVAGGSATVAYRMTAGSFIGNGAALTNLPSTEANTYTSSKTFTSTLESAGFTDRGQATVTSTLTVVGNAFSVGASTFVVTGGKVGIGTTEPITKLAVLGTGGTVGTSTGTASFMSSGLQNVQIGRNQSASFYMGIIAGSADDHLVFYGNQASFDGYQFSGASGLKMTIPSTPPTTGGALCLNASRVLTKCTSAVDASGNCTCP